MNKTIKKYNFSVNLNTKNTNFNSFTIYADDLVKQEVSFVTGGIAGVVDALIAAIRGGEALSMALIKKLFKSLGKTVPVVGTLMALYSFGSTWMDAKKAYDAI